MKYQAEIAGERRQIELQNRDGRITASIDGRTYDVELHCPEPGVYLLLVGGRVYEVRITGNSAEAKFDAHVGSELFPVQIIDPKHLRRSATSGAEGRQQLVAPMPGKVVRVLLAAGDEVEVGQGVVVIEAMKMQNEIKSPKKGKIIEIRVAEGQTVNAGEVLAVVD